ncbi:MAG: choice-of-anchor Q domain-containing protein, partial [Rhodanobacteraceae bacterium]
MTKHRSDDAVTLQHAAARQFSPRPLVAAVTRALPGAMLLSAGALLSPAALAATYPVSNNNDSGSGSLRDAIDQANANPGADIVTFNSSVTGTINLTTTSLLITDDVDIQGPGASVLTVNGSGIVTLGATHAGHTHHGKGERNGGGNATQGGGYYYGGGTGGVFTIDTSQAPGVAAGTATTQQALASSTVSISGLTISGGRATNGGGIFGYDTDLTVSQCVVSGNTAYDHGGGISIAGKYASLLVTDSTVTGNRAYYGGGVATTQSAITIQRSTISNNVAFTDGEYGGGGVLVHNDNNNILTITDSTITGNHSYYNAGGVFVRHTEAHISNSTIANNTADVYGGGLYLHGAYSGTRVTNSTITGNRATDDGGGISQSANYSYSGLTLSNTVVAGNSTSNGSNPDVMTNSYGIFTDHSLIQDAGSATIVDNGGNIFNQNPMLGALTNNGGPTLTQLPQAGSPLIDAGDPAFTGPPNNAQRGAGFPRVINGTVDI